MDTQLYLYCDHEEIMFYLSDIKFPKEILYCKACKKSDMLICVGTREEILRKFEDEVERIKKMLYGEIPQEYDFANLGSILKFAENNLVEVKKAFERYDERNGR